MDQSDKIIRKKLRNLHIDVKLHGLDLEYVPIEFLTREIVLEAVRQNGMALMD
jgi:hypothetical protein